MRGGVLGRRLPLGPSLGGRGLLRSSVALGSDLEERGLREEGKLQHAPQLGAEGAGAPDEGGARRLEPLYEGGVLLQRALQRGGRSAAALRQRQPRRADELPRLRGEALVDGLALLRAQARAAHGVQGHLLRGLGVEHCAPPPPKLGHLHLHGAVVIQGGVVGQEAGGEGIDGDTVPVPQPQRGAHVLGEDQGRARVERGIDLLAARLHADAHVALDEHLRVADGLQRKLGLPQEGAQRGGVTDADVLAAVQDVLVRVRV
eukprot:scaffold113291_cov63-Phaeocystis_antarctica.AAC.1